VLFLLGLGLGLVLRLDLVSGWLAVMHTYLYCISLSLYHTLREHGTQQNRLLCSLIQFNSMHGRPNLDALRAVAVGEAGALGKCKSIEDIRYSSFRMSFD